MNSRERYLRFFSTIPRPLLERIQNGEIDPSYIITHRMALDEAPQGYKMFRDKQDECMKVVLKP